MIVALMLSVLAGYGAAWLASRRWGRVVLAACAVAFLAEATRVPFTVNGIAARDFAGEKERPEALEVRVGGLEAGNSPLHSPLDTPPSLATLAWMMLNSRSMASCSTLRVSE